MQLFLPFISGSGNKSLWLRCFLSDRSEGGQETLPMAPFMTHMVSFRHNFLLPSPTVAAESILIVCLCYGSEMVTFILIYNLSVALTILSFGLDLNIS